jgi:hypothetical protein
MTRLDDGRGNIARLQWIKLKVLSVWVKSRSDIGLMDNLENVVRQNLKVMACPTDSLILMKCLRFSRESDGKVTVIKLVVDRFPEVET